MWSLKNESSVSAGATVALSPPLNFSRLTGCTRRVKCLGNHACTSDTFAWGSLEIPLRMDLVGPLAGRIGTHASDTVAIKGITGLSTSTRNCQVRKE